MCVSVACMCVCRVIVAEVVLCLVVTIQSILWPMLPVFVRLQAKNGF